MCVNLWRFPQKESVEGGRGGDTTIRGTASHATSNRKAPQNTRFWFRCVRHAVGWLKGSSALDYIIPGSTLSAS